jgi:predicted nucleic acid-binding protein
VKELVLDASVAISAVVEEANSEIARDILLRVAEVGGYVPGLWHLEVGQTLLVAERLGRMTRSQRLLALETLSELPIAVDDTTHDQAWRGIMAAAEQYRLSVYDAAYLELSLRLGLPLATFDLALRRAATSAGVELL